MAAGRVLLRVRLHSGLCLDLLQSGIVRTSSRPLRAGAEIEIDRSRRLRSPTNAPNARSDLETPILS